MCKGSRNLSVRQRQRAAGDKCSEVWIDRQLENSHCMHTYNIIYEVFCALILILYSEWQEPSSFTNRIEILSLKGRALFSRCNALS
jgi:hypothetical protein